MRSTSNHKDTVTKEDLVRICAVYNMHLELIVSIETMIEITDEENLTRHDKWRLKQVRKTLDKAKKL